MKGKREHEGEDKVRSDIQGNVVGRKSMKKSPRLGLLRGVKASSTRAGGRRNPNPRAGTGGRWTLSNLRSGENLFLLHNTNMVDKKRPPCIRKPNHVAPFPRR